MSADAGAPVRLDLMTWPEVEAALARGAPAILPVGPTEQHGPMGLVGTDALCAGAVAERAAALCDAVVAPKLPYGPAPFNTAFPGTVSIPAALLRALAEVVLEGLAAQGFGVVGVLDGHGANAAPLEAAARAVAARRPGVAIRVAAWWAAPEVDRLRRALYGDWEGMHATPSEVAITQAAHRRPPVPPEALTPPEPLPEGCLEAHAGDRHGPPDEHRAGFPDGRVGSHSALARPEHGAELLDAAARGLAAGVLAMARPRS